MKEMAWMKRNSTASNAGSDSNVCKESPKSLAAWLVAQARARLGGHKTEPPRLAVLERVTLAPRQSLSLVEADGQRVLVATTNDSAPAFYPLAGEKRPVRSETFQQRAAMERRGVARRRMW